MIKESEKKTATPTINPDTYLEVKKNVFRSVPYVPDLSEEFRRIIDISMYGSSSKESTSLNLSICTLKIKNPSQTKQNII